MYTHVTPIGPCYLFRSFRSIFVYNSKRVVNVDMNDEKHATNG